MPRPLLIPCLCRPSRSPPVACAYGKQQRPVCDIYNIFERAGEVALKGDGARIVRRKPSRAAVD